MIGPRWVHLWSHWGKVARITVPNDCCMGVQVVADFTADENLLRASSASKEVIEDFLDKQYQQEMAWVERDSAVSTDARAPWRVRTRHRKYIVEWLMYTEHQFRQTFGVSMSHMEIPKDPALRLHWSSWPLVSYPGDQGSVEEARVICVVS
jgi:hypothetical protein